MTKTIKALFSVFLVFALVFSGTVFASAQTVELLSGDADRDGEITSADARFALRLSVGLEQSTEENIKICDVDFSGKADSADARLILRASVGLENFGGKTVTVDIQETVKDTSIFTVAQPVIPQAKADKNTFTITVYGNGHGVGMSQWGAVFMADAGFTYEEIIAYFYRGTYVANDISYPEKTLYRGKEYKTEELVALITDLEIGGIVNDDDALKAQAVAVYTLLKYYDFNDTNASSGVASSKEYSKLSSKVKDAVHSVMGQYVALASDMTASPVLTVYSALHAGKSLDASYTWGGSYPVSVDTPFEYKLAEQTIAYYHDKNGDLVRAEILDTLGNVIYTSVYDESGNRTIVFDNRKIRQTEYFAIMHVYPAEYLKQKILKYDNGIVLDENPAKWFTITEKFNVMSNPDIGYVKAVTVGNKEIRGVGGLSSALELGLRSGCFTITYNNQ